MEFIGDEDDPKKKEYRDKLLGQSVIDNAPKRYWELQMMVNTEGALAVWEDLSIHRKAELRAYYQLNNMAELLRQHADNMQQARKSAVEKTKTTKK